MAMGRIGYIGRVSNDDAPPNRIRELREKIGLSQTDLARMINVTPSALNKVEKGSRGLDQEWMRRIAPALGVTAAELLPPEDNPWGLSEDERDLIHQYRQAPPRDQDKLLKVADVVLGFRAEGGAA